MTDIRLQNAIGLVRAGKIMEARGLLEPMLKADPANISVWFWYAETWPSTAQRTRILEACLRANPNHGRVTAALDALKSQASGVDVLQTDPVKRSFPPPGPAPAPMNGPNDSISRLQEKSSKQVSMSGPVPKPGTEGSKGNRSSIWLFLGAATLFLAFFSAVVILAFNSIPKDPAKYRHDQPVEYYLYAPGNYSADHEWPLFVGIHGSGGSGLECWNLWQAYADKEGFILLCPSIADAGGGWYQSDGEAKTFSAINQVRANYRVSSREFVVGFSAGAQFVQGFAFKYPQYVSGVSVLSAGNYYTPNLGARGIPFLVVIGDQDDPLGVQGSEIFASSLSRTGFEVQYVVLPGVGHTVTDKGKELTIALFRKTIGK